MSTFTKRLVTMLDLTKAAKVYKDHKEFRVAIPVNLDSVSKTNLILGSKTINGLNCKLNTAIKKTCKKLSNRYPSMLVWVSEHDVPFVRHTLDSEAMSTYYFTICVSTDKYLSEKAMTNLINEIRVHIMANVHPVIESALRDLNRECDRDDIYNALYTSNLDYATDHSDIIDHVEK